MSSYLVWTRPTTSNQIWEKAVSGEEWRGNLACVGAAWLQLGEGVMSTERDWNGLFLGLLPLVTQSSLNHTTLHRPHSSISARHSCTVPFKNLCIHGLITVYADWWETQRWVWEPQTESSQTGLQRKMSASVVVPWFLSCAIVLWLECVLRLPQDESGGRELCVMELACCSSTHCSWFNNESKIKTDVAENFDMLNLVASKTLYISVYFCISYRNFTNLPIHNS